MRWSSKSGSRRRRPRAMALVSDSIAFMRQYAVAFMLPGYTGEARRKMQGVSDCELSDSYSARYSIATSARSHDRDPGGQPVPCEAQIMASSDAIISAWNPYADNGCAR